MSDRTLVNRIYGSYFNNTFPARAAAMVAGLPEGARAGIRVAALK